MVWKGAILGVGNIALQAHVPAFQTDEFLRQRVRIVAVVEPVEARHAAIRERLPEARIYRDAADLFRSERLDFVDICAPPHVHRDLIRQAVRHGCHVLCEKPLAPRLSDARAIARLLRDRPRVLMVCHQYRYAPVWQALRALIAEGRLGPVGFADITVLRAGPDPGAGDWHPYWRVDARVSGGGILMDTGIHYIDLLRWILGPPVAVWARTQVVRYAGSGVEDTALVCLQYPAGWATLHLSWAAQGRQNRFFFIGPRATALYDGGVLWLQADGALTELVREPLSDKSCYVRWYAGLFRDFVVRLEAWPASAGDDDPLEEAVATLDILAACYRSARVHRWVPLVSTRPAC
ncbi:Glucose--fructose oxidoreductase [bacterium HR11]|nr:Glucose--fructose oxidoreductase [bacterium HR11]